MKKTITIAAAFAALMAGKATAQAATITEPQAIKKEINPTVRKRKGEKVEILAPDFPEAPRYYDAPYLSPFFNPTRSMRVKNKILRKRNGK